MTPFGVCCADVIMMRRSGLAYAADTEVPSDRTIAEIKTLVTRHGATGYLYAESPSQAMIMFELRGRQIKFVVPLPDRNAREFTRTPARGFQRSEAEAIKAWEQATRTRWRALLLVIKAKLEAIAIGVGTFEDEFLANTLLPGGRTGSEWVQAQGEKAYIEGHVPPMMPLLGAGGCRDNG